MVKAKINDSKLVRNSDDNTWCLYILKCRDKSYYTGITKELDERLNKHAQGIASKYTRARLPIKLIFHRQGLTHSQALKEEYRIKQLNRQQKEALIYGA